MKEKNCLKTVWVSSNLLSLNYVILENFLYVVIQKLRKILAFPLRICTSYKCKAFAIYIYNCDKKKKLISID